MRDSELCALIDRQCRTSIGVADLYAQQRETAMSFYLGEAKGELAPSEIEGRSKVVSKDLMDTVEWAMPGIMEALTGADDVVSFRPRRREDEDAAKDATAYVNHVIYEENEGFITLHDAIKQALIARMGVGKVWCDKSHEEKEERYVGLSAAEVEALRTDPDIEIVAEELTGYDAGPDGQPVESFTVTAKLRTPVTRFKVEGVPPDEFRISRDARTLETAEFTAHEVERSASDLISEGWPKDEVAKLPRGTSYRHEAAERYEAPDRDDEGDESQGKIVVTEAYIRVDTNDSGVSELRRVVKAGTYIHENEVTDDHPFFLFTPVLMPYKVIGLSMHDLVEDLMRIKTALMRQVLDNVYLTNTPQREVVEGQVNLDDLLQPKPGGVVRVKQSGAVRDLAVPFVAGAGLSLIQFVDQVRDTRTGVTEANSAMNAESLAKGAVGSEGVQALMSAGQQRIRLIARVLAETGIKRLYKLVLKNVTQYQDRAEQVQINGRWMQINPREWKNGFRLRVKVGVGAMEKRQEIANLTLIGSAQEKLLQAGLVQPQNLYATAVDLAKAMGYHDPERYFSPPNPNPAPPEPPMELQLEQMRQQGQQQLAQVKAQQEVMTEQMRQQAQAEQKHQELQQQADRDRMKVQAEMELERFKAELRMQTELELARITQATELQKAQMTVPALPMEGLL